MLYAGLETHTNRFRPGLRPGPTGLAYTSPPDLVDGQGAGTPRPQETHPCLGPSGPELWPVALAPSCLLTFDYLPPPLDSVVERRWVRRCRDGDVDGSDVSNLLRHVQDYDGHDDEDDDDDDDDDEIMSGVSLTAAALTARHLYILSRRIKSTLRRDLKSAFGLTSITLDGY